MTRPKPSGSRRIRQYKSCTGCRQVKGRCVGVDEDYLKALDDAEYVHPETPPRCTRCERRDEECVFEPSRRIGRPRRLPTYGAPMPYPPSTSSHSSHSSRSSLAPGSASLGPSPPARIQDSAPPSPSDECVDHSVELAPISATFGTTACLPRPPPLGPGPVLGLEWIATAYLKSTFVWNPLLPPVPEQLHLTLATCDPLLLVAINCNAEPSLPCAPFPPPTFKVSLSLLQAAVFFAFHAYGIGDQTRASGIAQWAMAVIRQLGWNGDDPTEWSDSVNPKERAALVACGWKLFSLVTTLGVLTGDRTLFVAVEIPNEVTPRNMFHHALVLLRDTTDHDYLEALGPVDRNVYVDWIIGRSESISRCALEYLDSTTPAAYDDDDDDDDGDPQSLVLAAARESAFTTAILSACSIILALTERCRGGGRCAAAHPHRRRPISPWPGIESSQNVFSCSSSSSSLGRLNAHAHAAAAAEFDSKSASIARATNQILYVSKTTRDRRGRLVALDPAHAPTWTPFWLVAASGLLSLRQTSQRVRRTTTTNDAVAERGGFEYDVSEIAERQVEEDLEFCDVVLAHQGKWPIVDTVRTELRAMRTNTTTTTNLTSFVDEDASAA